MNTREYRYARVMRSGIQQAIREMAHAGFRIDAIECRKLDLKLLKKISPTKSSKISGVQLRVTEDPDLQRARFRIITNQPDEAAEMMRQTNMRLPDGLTIEKQGDTDPEM